jgi:MFS family permease
MLVGLGFGQIVTWGILYYAFSVIVTPMEASLGWSRTTVTGAFSLALLVSGLAAVPVGRWLDRHGPRVLVTTGSIASCVLVAAWAGVTHPITFYAIWALLGATMATQLYEPPFWIAMRWFEGRTHRALTIITVMGGLASPVFLPLTSYLVQHLGWRVAILALSGILALTTVPLHAILLRAPPDGGLERKPFKEDHVTDSPDTRKTLRWVATAFFLNGFSTAVVTVHFVPFLVGRHHGLTFAAWAAGLVGGMQVAARLLFIPVRAMLPVEYPLASVLLIQILALAVLPFAGLPAAALLFAAVFGAANGLLTLLRASRVAEIFGTEAYGVVAGFIAAGATIARASGPVSAGVLYSLHHDYRMVFIALLVANVAAFAAGTVAERRAQRAG